MIYGYKNIWKVAGPILLGMVIQQLIGVTDVVFLGRVGQAELGASAIAGLYYITIYMLGVGFGVMFPAYNTLYVNLAPNNQRGTATSTYLTSWDVGIGLGISTGGYIAEHYAFDAVYLFGSVLCVVSMLYFNLYVSPHFHRNKVR